MAGPPDSSLYISVLRSLSTLLSKRYFRLATASLSFQVRLKASEIYFFLKKNGSMPEYFMELMRNSYFKGFGEQ